MTAPDQPPVVFTPIELCLVFGVIDALFTRIDEGDMQLSIDDESLAVVNKIRAMVLRGPRNETGNYTLLVAPFQVQAAPKQTAN